MRVFDELIQNRDRNQGNILWTSDLTMWLIDHTRAFRLGRDAAQAGAAGAMRPGAARTAPCAHARGAGRRRSGSSLTKQEQEALLLRRDKIVKHYDDRIARLGEPVVLFTM